MHNHWNLRVYLLIRHRHTNALLVACEKIRNSTYIKLPGGGVEFGEGIAAAAHREAMEELGSALCLESQYYFTENYLPSLLKKSDQVVAFYYLATLPSDSLLYQDTRIEACDGSDQYFEWIKPSDLDPSSFKLASDRIVLERWIHEQNK